MKRIFSYFSTFCLGMILFISVPFKIQASELSSYSPVFDSQYYSDKYEDLKAAYGTDETLLLHHFLSTGMAEGRQASSEFNVQTYLNNYADLCNSYGNDFTSYYLHYIFIGKSEGRIANQDLTALKTTSIISEEESPHSMFSENQWNFANRVMELVNEERIAYGLSTVSTHYNLFGAAQKRAMELTQVISHTRPDGSSFFSVFDNYCVNYQRAGENIAAGQKTPQEVVIAWMNSPGHRANILNDKFNHLGVGCFTTNSAYHIYWVQLFTD